MIELLILGFLFSQILLPFYLFRKYGYFNFSLYLKSLKFDSVEWRIIISMIACFLFVSFLLTWFDIYLIDLFYMGFLDASRQGPDFRFPGTGSRL